MSARKILFAPSNWNVGTNSHGWRGVHLRRRVNLHGRLDCMIWKIGLHGLAVNSPHCQNVLWMFQSRPRRFTQRNGKDGETGLEQSCCLLKKPANSLRVWV